MLAVEESYRGMGLGTRLVQSVIKVMEERECDEVTECARVDNKYQFVDSGCSRNGGVQCPFPESLWPPWFHPRITPFSLLFEWIRRIPAQTLFGKTGWPKPK